MGSSGSGSFSDYSGSATKPDGQGGASGGGSGEDRCRQAFNADLEEVAQYEYFVKSNSVPASGTALRLELKGRVVAVDSAGMPVGALPTRLNYLAACLRSGIQYSGVVRISANTPLPRVNVDFIAV